MKIYGKSYGKSLAIFGNFWKTSETVQNDFKIFGKSSEAFGIFLEIFGKILETVQKCFSDVFYFFKFSVKHPKSSEVFENHREISGRDGKMFIIVRSS